MSGCRSLVVPSQSAHNTYVLSQQSPAVAMHFDSPTEVNSLHQLLSYCPYMHTPSAAAAADASISKPHDNHGHPINSPSAELSNNHSD